MKCEHPSITAGVIRVGKRGAVGAFCPECNSVTWTARDRKPLRQSIFQAAESREQAVREWLAT